MGTDREVIDTKKIWVKDVFAVWTVNGETHCSQSITCIKGSSFLKIKINHEDGTFIFDANTILVYPDLKIKFYLKQSL